VTGVCMCALSLGFFRGGLCDKRGQEEDKWEQGMTLIRRLDPAWTFRPPFWSGSSEGSAYVSGPHLQALGPTQDGDAGDVVLAKEGLGEAGFWTLSVSVNDHLLFHTNIDGRGWIKTERLEPYLVSIPVVQDWMRLAVNKLMEGAKARITQPKMSSISGVSTDWTAGPPPLRLHRFPAVATSTPSSETRTQRGTLSLS